MKSLRTLFHKGKRSGNTLIKTRVHELMHPGREWVTGLSIAVLLFVTGSAYLGYDFLDQYHGIDTEVVADSTVVRYRKQDAAHFLELYRTKKETFEQLRADQRFRPSPPAPATAEATSTVSVAPEPLAEEAPAQYSGGAL